MISLFETVKRGVKRIRRLFTFRMNSSIHGYPESLVVEEALHSISVFLDSFCALKRIVLTVERDRGTTMVYQGGLNLGFSCNAATDLVHLDVAAKKHLELENQIYEKLHQKAKKLKDPLKKGANQHMGSAGGALKREFVQDTEKKTQPLESMENQASLLIQPTRAAAGQNEPQATGGNQYG